ncbi:MAG TPA: DUF642 domain-containing protein [Candidatus Paceibacterota bacterium]|nr:DUF642 domain-containing protein [Verrucomicrobiota bacterium]HRY48725.1 DUF642 domain-containing protein [Candidatus Paceibacterota bacterium]HSA00557.1 DUF642 domain-containing protein [Candidatus Paceibacterota bacterium]
MKTYHAVFATGFLLFNLNIEASLLVNGSFEEGNYTGNASWTGVSAGGTAVDGWIATQAGFDWHQGTPPINGAEFGPAYDSIRMIDLTFWDAWGGIKQEFGTVPGETYTITWAVASPAGDSTYAVEAAGYTWDFSVAYSGRYNMDWKTESVSFTALSDLTTLEFKGKTANYWGAVIDDVSVRSAPVPEGGTTLALMGLVLCYLANHRGR